MTKVEKIIEACEDKKARDIVSLKIDPDSAIADYFVIASGGTVTQTRAIANGIEEALEEEGIEILGKEGYREGGWILLDYGDVILHIFTEENREYYDLERLWKNGVH